MKDFIDYIEDSCADIPDGKMLYSYKKKLFDEITERANEIIHSGLTDRAVLCDLIRDEYPDIKRGYEAFAEAENKKTRSKFMRKLNFIGSALFLLILFGAYFAVSFTMRCWSVSWLIIVGGISALTVYLLSFAIKKLCRMRRIFQLLARVLTAVCIMLVAVFAFLFCLMLLPVAHSWTIVLAGVILAFAADAVFAAVTKQKLAIINYFLYIPASAALLYVILAAYNIVSWNYGWLIIIGAVAADIAIAAGVMINNAKYIYKQEAEDVWSEN